jgi:hypothetical protein
VNSHIASGLEAIKFGVRLSSRLRKHSHLLIKVGLQELGFNTAIRACCCLINILQLVLTKGIKGVLHAVGGKPPSFRRQLEQAVQPLAQNISWY